MLDKHSEKSLYRTEQGPVDHDRAMLLIVVTSVLKLEPFRQIPVKLDGPQLPNASDRIFYLDIDLRTIERSLALDPFVRNTSFF